MYYINIKIKLKQNEFKGWEYGRKKPFIPSELPLGDKINQLLFMNDLIKANTKIGIYNTLLNQSKINKRLLIAPIAL